MRDAVAALEDGGKDVEVCTANLESASSQGQALLLVGIVKPEALTPAERAAGAIAAAGEGPGSEAARAEAIGQEELWQEYKQLARQQLQRPVSGRAKDLKEQLAITATSIALLKDQLRQLHSKVAGAMGLLEVPDQLAAAVDVLKEVAQGVEQLPAEASQALEADAPPMKRRRLEQTAEAALGAAAGSTEGTEEGGGSEEEEGGNGMLGESQVGGRRGENGGAGAPEAADGEEEQYGEPELVEVRKKEIPNTNFKILIKVYQLGRARLKGLMVDTLSYQEVREREWEEGRSEREKRRPRGKMPRNVGILAAKMQIPFNDRRRSIYHPNDEDIIEDKSRSSALAAAQYLDFCSLFAHNLYKLTFSDDVVPGLFPSALFDPSLASHPLVVGSRTGRLPALRCIRCCNSPWGVWLVLAGGLHGAWPQLQQLYIKGSDWDSTSFKTQSLDDELQDTFSSYGSVVGKASKLGRFGRGNPGAAAAEAASAGVEQLSQLEMLTELGVR